MRRAALALGLSLVPLGIACSSDEPCDGLLIPPAHLSRDDGRAIVDRVVAESDWSRPDGCPTVADRWLRDARFEWSPPPGVGQQPINLLLDWLAPAGPRPVTATCAGGDAPAVGIGVWGHAADERPVAGDGQTWTPWTLDFLRNERTAAIEIVDLAFHAYAADPPGPCDSLAADVRYASRAEVEAGVEAAVREVVAELRADGF